MAARLRDLIPLRGEVFNADPRGEEFAPIAPRLDLEMGDSEWALPGECRYLEPLDLGLVFSAFVDGVQRTVLVGRFRAPAFFQVPLHVFEVAAGYVVRGGDRRVRAGGWARIRGVVAPFAAAFGRRNAVKEVASALAEALGARVADGSLLNEDPLAPVRRDAPELWVFDASLLGLGGDAPLLSEEELANEARVRMLALAKVAHARQALELAAHLAIRGRELGLGDELSPTLFLEPPSEGAWVMHDGPLFFTARRRKLTLKRLALEPELVDRAVLGRVVGYVKHHRMRPADVECVLGTPAGRLTEARSHRGVEPPDTHFRLETAEEDDRHYATDVYSAYVRLYDDLELRRIGVSGTGLVRMQFAPQAIAALGAQDRQETARVLAGAVYRERIPVPRYRFQPYALAALELFLRGKLTHPERLRRTALRWFV